MKRLNYCGLGYYNITQKVSELVPDLNKRVGWPVDTELTLYEEQGSNMVQKITNLNDTLEKVSESTNHCFVSIKLNTRVNCIYYFSFASNSSI